jgi:ferredoxin-NADP reductase
VRGENEESRLARIRAIRPVATDINSFELVPADGRPFPAFTAGAHIDVQVPNGLIRQYSLHGDPSDRSVYRIAVKREHGGRGGSMSLHDVAEVGDAMAIVGPRNHFPLDSTATRHLFVAGGIGITPIAAMIQALAHQGRAWDLHYCARTPAHAAFYDELKAMAPERVTPHFSEAPIFDAAGLLRAQVEGTHVYCCGPPGLMKAVDAATTHWPAGHVHFEWFAAPQVEHPPNGPFEVELARTGEILVVPPDKSILQVLRDHGVDVPSACEEGVCGTCETRVLAGQPQHRDIPLSAEERAENRSMMVCVSRANSARLVLDL